MPQFFETGPNKLNNIFTLRTKNPYRIISALFSSILMAMVLMGTVQTASAAPTMMTRYVEIDPVTHTAYMFDENFVQFPDNPNDPKTSIMDLPANSASWYIGADFDVVRRNNDDSIDILSNDPAYSEMIHHIGLFYSTPNRVFYDACFPGGISPFASIIATGSELTSVTFPKAYGYKLDGGELTPGTWHWTNPANVSLSDKLYLRFNIRIDEENVAYRATTIDRVNSKPCASAFSVSPGKSKYVGSENVITSKRRMIMMNIHIHDHVKSLKLKSSKGTLRKFKPENRNIPVEHEDTGQGSTPFHSHKGHLTANSLTPWTPGKYGPVIDAGESLWVETKFSNPHPRDIDSMAILVYFWESIDENEIVVGIDIGKENDEIED